MIWIGTSGYNYPEWRGSFYPPGFPTSKMLPYYASRFSTVEINYTFYRMPSEKSLQDWAAATPDSFVFTLKAPRRITHDARLQNCEDLAKEFFSRAQKLGPKLGVLLFQLSPWFRKDLDVLDAFLHQVTPQTRAAFEFRHASWYSEEVFTRLKEGNLGLCVTDSEDVKTPLVATADYGYFRLRDEGYEESDIQQWAETIVEYAAGLQDVFVYFKHEEEGKGPELAKLLRAKIAPLRACAVDPACCATDSAPAIVLKMWGPPA